jgi:uncharacterized repeat protein (TIGR01451 family)
MDPRLAPPEITNAAVIRQSFPQHMVGVERARVLTPGPGPLASSAPARLACAYVNRSIAFRALVALALAAAITLGLTGTASASVTLGQTAGSTDNCGNNQNFLQAGTGAAAPSYKYAGPGPGVVVSWSYLAHANTPNVKLKVYTPTGSPTVWHLRAHSAQRLGGSGEGGLHANQLNTFTESPGIPIAKDDVLGMTARGPAGSMGCIATGDNADVVRVCCAMNNPTDTPEGQDSTFLGSLPNTRADISAVVEPDADGDHFGDESQDGCPSDPAVHDTTCPVDVSIVKTVSASPAVGHDVTYTLAVKNTAASAAHNVSITDALPAGQTFVSSSVGQGSCTGTTTVTCALGEFGPGASTTATIVVRPTAVGPVSNTASVTTDSPDTDGTNNSSTVAVTVGATPVPVLSALKLGPTAFVAARSGPSVTAAAKRGTVISYTTTEVSTTTFRVSRRARGVKKGRSCVAPPKHKPRKKPRPCTRFLSRGSFTHQDLAGQVSFRFTGRVRGKTLKPGRYRLRAVARNSTGAGKARVANFRVKRK